MVAKSDPERGVAGGPVAGESCVEVVRGADALIEIRKGAECSVHRVTTRPADRMPDRDRAPARDVVRPGGNTVALWA